MIESFGMAILMGLAFTLYLFLPVWGHLVTLRGLGCKIPNDDSLKTFSLADGMILIGLISLATSLSTAVPINVYTPNWVLIVSINAFAVLMWHKCNKLMQRNAIVDVTSKLVMHLFTYPSSILSLGLLFSSGLFTLVGAVAIIVPNYDDPIEQVLPYNFITLLVACGWVYLTRLSFIRILKRNRTLSLKQES